MKKSVNYKLYRDLNQIFHPSISRQNISNYKIIIKDNLVPIEVFYPKKDIELKKLIIYITMKDHDICDDLAIFTNSLVFVIGYHENNFFDKCYDIIKYIYSNIENYNISKENIAVMSDYNNSDILEKIISKSKETQDFLTRRNIFLNDKSLVEKNNNQLFIPSIDSCYSLYNKDQVFEIINEFLI